MSMKASKWFVLAVWATLVHLAAHGQKVTFRFMMDGEPLVLDSAMVVQGRGPVTVETFRFYVADMALGAHAAASPQRHHLVDAADPETWAIDLEDEAGRKAAAEVPVISDDRLEFSLGIDSLTNVSGALGGDLDPTLGMYWAWQSGYVNMKIEGTNPNCPARGNHFQYHLGGYSGAFNAIQRVKLPITDRDKALVILVDIGAFLRQVNIAEEYEVMSPSLRAVGLSRLAVDMFSIAE